MVSNNDPQEIFYGKKRNRANFDVAKETPGFLVQIGECLDGEGHERQNDQKLNDKIKYSAGNCLIIFDNLFEVYHFLTLFGVE